ncbi:O-antigen ligase family protein [Saccharospirillum alexandrii]|uniref:O-antigen ligase family protein n=1 Tax=Saccharospirillum alexandrii TaxID=2448477 RepID=UPI000FDB3DBD|nr:O-antigen ligase family protein [Saccharospirillum alexandrii]
MNRLKFDRAFIEFFTVGSILLTLSVSFDYKFDAISSTVNRALILVLACTLIFVTGKIKIKISVFIGYLLVFIASIVFNDVGLFRALTAYIGLCVPWLFFLTYSPSFELKRKIPFMIALLPLVSVFFGLLFQLFGISSVFRAEYTGVSRLQGANIPAHFSFLAYVAFLSSLFLWISKAKYAFFFIILNLLLLSLALTRGPMLLAAIASLYVFFVFRLYLNRKVITLVLMAFPFILLGSFFIVERVMMRSTAIGSDGSVLEVNTSGRLEAWHTYFELAKKKPFFGYGVGTSTEVRELGYTNFGVPHNEYLRFFYEYGLIGGFVLFIFISWAFLKGSKSMPYINRKLYYLFLTLFVLYAIFDNVLITYQFLIPFLLLMLSLRSRSNE